MELDEFSQLFNQQFDQFLNEKSAEELLLPLRERSGTALDRIMRNLLLEVILGVLALLFMGFIAYQFDSITIHWLSSIIWLLGIVQLIAFTWQYRQLQRMIEPAVTNLRTHLQQQIRVVERFIKTYLAFCFWTVPICFFLGAYLGYTLAANDLNDPALRPLDEIHLSFAGLSIVLVSILGLVIGLFVGIKAYVRWLYGRHLEQLKSCLFELEHSE